MRLFELIDLLVELRCDLRAVSFILLQKIGPACVAAHNAYQMCLALPGAVFLAMEARHCAGAEMQDMMGYAAAIGSAAAKKEGQVTIYSGFSGAPEPKEIAKQFEARYGIPVRILEGRAGEIQERVRAEVAAGRRARPPGDAKDAVVDEPVARQSVVENVIEAGQAVVFRDGWRRDQCKDQQPPFHVPTNIHETPP